MKVHTIGVFPSRADAERAINEIHNVGVPNDEISFLYRNEEGKVREVDAGKVSSNTPGEGASAGATTGAVVGGLAGLAVATGILPVLGPLLVAGPLIAALGIGGAVGTTAAGAVTGAVAGGLIGALANLGVGKERAQRYQDRVMAGDILVAVHADESIDVAKAMMRNGAAEAEVFTVKV